MKNERHSPYVQSVAKRQQRGRTLTSLPYDMLHTIIQYTGLCEDFEAYAAIFGIDFRRDSDGWWFTGGIRYKLEEKSDYGIERVYFTLADGVEPTQDHGPNTILYTHCDDLAMRKLWNVWSFKKFGTSPNHFVLHLRTNMWRTPVSSHMSRREYLMRNCTDRLRVLAPGREDEIATEQVDRLERLVTMSLSGMFIGGSHYHEVQLQGYISRDEWWGGFEPGSRCTREELALIHATADSDSDSDDENFYASIVWEPAAEHKEEEDEPRLITASFNSNRLISTFGNGPPPSHPYRLLGFANQHLRGPNGKSVCPASWRFSVEPVFFRGSIIDYQYMNPSEQLDSGVHVDIISGNHHDQRWAFNFRNMCKTTRDVLSGAWYPNPLEDDDAMPDYKNTVGADGLKVCFHFGIEESFLPGEESFTLDPLECVPFHQRGLFLKHKEDGIMREDDLWLPVVVKVEHHSFLQLAGVALKNGLMGDAHPPRIGRCSKRSYGVGISRERGIGQDLFYI